MADNAQCPGTQHGLIQLHALKPCPEVGRDAKPPGVDWDVKDHALLLFALATSFPGWRSIGPITWPNSAASNSPGVCEALPKMPAAQALPTHLNISRGSFDDLERQCHEAMMDIWLKLVVHLYFTIFFLLHWMHWSFVSPVLSSINFGNQWLERCCFSSRCHYMPHIFHPKFVRSCVM